MGAGQCFRLLRNGQVICQLFSLPLPIVEQIITKVPPIFISNFKNIQLDEISYFRIQQTCKDIIQLVENKRNIRVCSCKRRRLAYGTNDEGSLYFRLNWGDTALTKRPYGVRFAALETVFWTDQGKAPFSLSF